MRWLYYVVNLNRFYSSGFIDQGYMAFVIAYSLFYINIFTRVKLLRFVKAHQD